MTGIVKKALLGAAMAATAVTAAAPASAQYYGGYRHRGGGDAAAGAVIGGIIGLGLGAAIASGNNHRGYDRGYYNNGYYDDGYYARPRAYYNDYRYNYQPRCYVQRQYDRWSGTVYDTRVCR